MSSWTSGGQVSINTNAFSEAYRLVSVGFTGWFPTAKDEGRGFGSAAPPPPSMHSYTVLPSSCYSHSAPLSQLSIQYFIVMTDTYYPQVNQKWTMLCFSLLDQWLFFSYVLVFYLAITDSTVSLNLCTVIFSVCLWGILCGPPPILLWPGLLPCPQQLPPEETPCLSHELGHRSSVCPIISVKYILISF